MPVMFCAFTTLSQNLIGWLEIIGDCLASLVPGQQTPSGARFCSHKLPERAISSAKILRDPPTMAKIFYGIIIRESMVFANCHPPRFTLSTECPGAVLPSPCGISFGTQD